MRHVILAKEKPEAVLPAPEGLLNEEARARAAEVIPLLLNISRICYGVEQEGSTVTRTTVCGNHAVLSEPGLGILADLLEEVRVPEHAVVASSP